MIYVDLITGFLGSGKTTFIKKYVDYLNTCGEKIGIIENDFGAINIDVLMLEDLADRVVIEQVVGGSNRSEWSRRFKSKLIAMSMRGLTRVIIEPSGIFEPEWFFDVLYEDHVCDIYKVDRVITLVDYNALIGENSEADYLMASQLAAAGNVIVTKAPKASEARVEEINCLQELLAKHGLSKKLTVDFADINFESFVFNGYSTDEIAKKFFKPEDKLRATFVMNSKLTIDEQLEGIREVLLDKQYGNVLRLKGYVKTEEGFIEINATKERILSAQVQVGQEVLIFIGTELSDDKIKDRFNEGL